jgi:hypothetical protein
MRGREWGKYRGWGEKMQEERGGAREKKLSMVIT